MILFLSVLLLMILGYTIYSLTRHDQLYQEAAELASTVPAQELQAEERSLTRVVWVFFTGGALLTGTFAVQFFSGSDDPNTWTSSQWIYAAIGCVMTLAITLGQKHLYSRIHTTRAGLFITFLILLFVIFSEIATSSERTDLLVKHRSENSQVYQNVVGAINTPAPSTPVNTTGLANAQAAKAKAQVEIDACERHRRRGQRRVDECLRIEQGNLAAAEARIQAIQSQSTFVTEQALKQKLALVDKAKELQYDENQNPAIIRFLKTLFGGAILHSMILASLIAVVAFEAGFHFTGTRRAVVKHALLLKHGLKQASESANEKPSSKSDRSKVPVHVDMHVNMDKASQLMQYRYQQNERRKAGEEVHCPYCETAFKKRTYNHRFCKSACRDEYWNTVKPERRGHKKVTLAST